MRNGQEIYQKISRNIETVMRGQSEAICLILAAFVSGGHVLLEDFPGTGKTTLAKALALSIDATFKRIQFTPDLLPSDILGVSIYDPQDKQFRFHQGPIFTNILLADEINRASPRTQSALLEAMAESQVSIDGKLRKLESLFFVIATQNPVESGGTYPLPEAQMDRFTLKISLGYVQPEAEMAILTDQNHRHPIESVCPCAGKNDIDRLQSLLPAVRVSEAVCRYIVALVSATRTSPGVAMGASPRASLAMMKTARAMALFEDCDYVTPDHVQKIAIPVVAHRLLMDPQARFTGQTSETVVADILKTVPAPV